MQNYVEPFFGSGAVLLGRQGEDFGIETVNDADGFLANFWRAVQHDPDQVARWADWPVNENDLHARHAWLVPKREKLTAKLEGDPDHFDAKIAGWWVWGLCAWIGSGWCSGKGPWITNEEGELINSRSFPHLGDAGRGINRKLPHLGNAGRGVHRTSFSIYELFHELSERFRRVRVCCGDWTRVLGPTPTVKNGLTGIFLDPPYSADANRDNELYAVESVVVAHTVREWAIVHGDNPLLRIALCGYEGEYDMPIDWVCMKWKATGGYESQGGASAGENCRRERIWFSPHCIRPVELVGLFDGLEDAS